MRPLRVLHVTSVVASNYYLNNLVENTDPSQAEYAVVTLSSEGPFVSDLRARGVKALALNCNRRSQYPLAIRQLCSIIRAEEIDILHTHLFDPSLIGVFVGKLARRPVIMTRHHSDAIYRISSAVRRRAYLRAERWINQGADHIIAPSKMVRDILLQWEKVPSRKVSLVPYGQTSERFACVTSDQVAEIRDHFGMTTHQALVCVARLSEEKGHTYLFEAMQSLRQDGVNCKLYLVGTGPEQSRLEAQVAARGLTDHVRFLGWREDVLQLIAAADVVVHPSLQEALPSALIEALMLERPVVATDASGASDILGRNRYGVIVPRGDATALRDALRWTLDHRGDVEARARLGRRWLLRYMSAARVARAYVACYDRVASLQTG